MTVSDWPTTTGVCHLERNVLEAHDMRRAGVDHRVDAAQGPLVRRDDQQPTQERREGHEGQSEGEHHHRIPNVFPRLNRHTPVDSKWSVAQLVEEEVFGRTYGGAHVRQRF